MFRDIIVNVNWFDIIILGVIFRVFYIAFKEGLVTEAIKLMSVLFATIVSLHYYGTFSQYFRSKLPLPENIAVPAAWVLLISGVLLVFKIAREGWMTVIFKGKVIASYRIAAGFFSFFRSILVCGLIFEFAFMSGKDDLQKAAVNSFSSTYFGDVTASVYQTSFDGVLNKLFPGEKINPLPFEYREQNRKKITRKEF